MNELILIRLAEQSGFLNDVTKWEALVELVVRECSNQCTTEGPFVAEVVWGKQFHKKILEHFGVTE